MAKCIRCGKHVLYGLNSEQLCPSCAAFIAKEQEEREQLQFDEASKAVSEALRLPDTLDGRVLLYSYENVEIYVPDPAPFDELDPGTHLDVLPCPDLRDDPHTVCLCYEDRSLAFLCSKELKEKVCDFNTRREKAIAIVPMHSRGEENIRLSLGFYGALNKVESAELDAFSLFKSYRLLGGDDCHTQSVIDSCALTERCSISYDGNRDVYLVSIFSGFCIGVLPPAATRYLEKYDAEEENIAFIKKVEENTLGDLEVTVSIGVHK